MAMQDADPVEIGGRTYFMRPLRAKHYTEAANYMISLRPRPMDIVVSSLAELPKEFHQTLIENAFQFELRGQWIPKNEVLAWLSTNAEGKVFCFWCMIKQEHAELSMDDAETLMTVLAQEESEASANLAEVTP